METRTISTGENLYRAVHAQYYTDLLNKQNECRMTAEECSRQMIRDREKEKTGKIGMFFSKIALGMPFSQKFKNL